MAPHLLQTLDRRRRRPHTAADKMMLLIGRFLLSVAFISAIAAQKMTGVHLRVAVCHEPPIFSIIRSPTNESSVRYVGFTKDFFDFLSSVLDFTYSFLEVTPSMVNNKGSIDAAIIDQILQKKADIDGRLISPTADRLDNMDFTLAISVLNFAVIQPMPIIQKGFMSPIKPFQSMVWFMIFVAFVFTVLFLSLITRVVKRQIKAQMNTRVVTENAWYSFAVLMAQGGYFPSNRWSLRFVAGSWCLIAVVLVYAYNGTLISNVSLPTHQPIVNTFEDLAASKTLRVTTQRGSLSAGIILDSKSGALKTLGDSLRRHPEDLLLTLPGEFEKILHSGCCAHVEVRRLGELLVYKSMVEHQGECKLTLGKDLDYTQVWSFGVAKNFPHLSNINSGIQLMRQSGLITRIGKSYLKPINKCLAIRDVGYKQQTASQHKNKSKLTLSDLADVFLVILGLGCVLSTMVFLLELLVFRKFTGVEREIMIL